VSYCRFGPESDVYVYESCSGGWECCFCGIGPSANFPSRTQMLDHLDQHVKAGHKVPDYAIARLREEMAEE
jgi:hypothetical protein